MPFLTTRLSKHDLLEKVTTAIKACGWHYLVLFNHHPFRLMVFKEHEAYTIKLYIWRLTHGGGSARPVNEFRIQITSHVSQFEPEPRGKTLILGWWEQAGVLLMNSTTLERSVKILPSLTSLGKTPMGSMMLHSKE